MSHLQPLAAPRGRRLRLAAELAGGPAQLALEDDAEVLGVVEARQLGDPVHFQIRLGQQLLDPLQLDRADLGLRRAAQVAAKLDAPVPSATAGVWPSTLRTLIPWQACSRMYRTAAATRASSMASTSVDCRVTTPSGGIIRSSKSAFSPAMSRSSSSAASYPIRSMLGTTLESGRVAELAEQRIVVHADDRHLIGDVKADPAQASRTWRPAHVVTGQDADRLGQELEPAPDRLLVPSHDRASGPPPGDS